MSARRSTTTATSTGPAITAASSAARTRPRAKPFTRSGWSPGRATSGRRPCWPTVSCISSRSTRARTSWRPGRSSSSWPTTSSRGTTVARTPRSPSAADNCCCERIAGCTAWAASSKWRGDGASPFGPGAGGSSRPSASALGSPRLACRGPLPMARIGKVKSLGKAVVSPAESTWCPMAHGKLPGHVAVGAVAFLALLAAVSVSPWWRPAAEPPPPTEAQVMSLPERERTYLWEMEHHVNLLTQLGLKALGGAIVGQKRMELERLFSDGFSGSVFEEPRQIRFENKSLSLSRLRQNEGPRRHLDRAGFIDWLLDLRRTFPQPPQARFDVMKMMPPSHDDFAGSWSVL